MNDNQGNHAASAPRTLVKKSHLLSYNRKLRHLKGISLRDLNIEPVQKQDLGSSLSTASSTRCVAREDSRAPRDNFTENAGTSATDPVSGNLELGGGSNDERSNKPAAPLNWSKTRRRRSTLDFNATARQRQQRLDDTIAYHLVDAFFSLHVSMLTDPIYVSEQIKSTMNPDFQRFDLSALDPRISQLEALTVKIWARPQVDSNWRFLEEAVITLPRLYFIGTSIEQHCHTFSENSIIFHLSDGVYSLSERSSHTLDSSTLLDVHSPAHHLQVSSMKSSSYDALMRLQTLHECIHDSMQTRIDINNDVKSLILGPKTSGATSREVVSARDSSAAASRSISTVRRSNKALFGQITTLRDSIRGRRTTIKECELAQNVGQQNLEGAQMNLASLQAANKNVLYEIIGQRRRICTDLSRIYPLDPAPEKTLLFKIRGLPLPNSIYPASGVKDEIMSAALGHVACLVQLLANYLSVPLPYPIEPRASTSRITDPVSLMAGSRTFPLYVGRGSVLFRFEYGIFLLNKNIELLSVRQGINVLDIRQTLPNLKFLFFVATAGKANLPMRKAGGIRGLTKGIESNEGTPSSSRRGSDDSATDDVALRDRLRQRIVDFTNMSGTKPNAPNQRAAIRDLNQEGDKHAAYTQNFLDSSSIHEDWRIGSTMSMQS